MEEGEEPSVVWRREERTKMEREEGEETTRREREEPKQAAYRHMDSTALVLGGPKIRSFSPDDLMPDTCPSISPTP